jgi:hypothetical protein
MCCETSGSFYDDYHSLKAITECVQQNSIQYCCTYEVFLSYNVCMYLMEYLSGIILVLKDYVIQKSTLRYSLLLHE